MLKIATLLILLVALIGISSADIVTLTKDNFAEPILDKVLKDYYFPGDSLSFNLTLQPKTNDDATKLTGRNYKFYTELESPSLNVQFVYTTGGSRTYSGKDYVTLDIPASTDIGINKIVISVSGKVPKMDKRIGVVTALSINIQDAKSDAVKPVKISVVNKDLFNSFISHLEKEYSDLNNRTSELEKKGSSVTDIKIKLESGKTKIDDGKKYFNNGKYDDANSTLVDAEKYINDAKDLIRKSEISLNLSDAKSKLESMFTKMSELEVLINKLKSQGKSTLSYEVKLQSFKERYADINTKIAQAQDYLNKKLYDDSQNSINDALSDIDKEMKSLNSLIAEISSIITPTPTPQKTSTPASKPSPTPFSKKISNYISGIKKWFSENKKRILVYGGVLIGIIVIGFAGYKGLKAYMKRKRWDELK